MLREVLHSHYLYLCFLLFSISGLCLADWRYKLAFWVNRRATWMAILIPMLLLIIFDIVGIHESIFSTNPQFIMNRFMLVTNLPAEEFVFVFLLCYVTLIIYRATKMRVLTSNTNSRTVFLRPSKSSGQNSRNARNGKEGQL